MVAALTYAFSHDSVSEQGREREGAERSPYTLYTKKEKNVPATPQLCSPYTSLARTVSRVPTAVAGREEEDDYD